MSQKTEMVREALNTVVALQYSIKKMNRGEPCIPVYNDKQAVGYMALCHEDGKSRVVLHSKTEACAFDGYARVPKEAELKYNNGLEYRQHVEENGKYIGYWSYGSIQNGWAKINGFVSGGELYPLGDEVAQLYQKHIGVAVVCLKNKFNQNMCRVYMVNGFLAKCDRLRGCKAGIKTAFIRHEAKLAKQRLLEEKRRQRIYG